MPSPEIIEFLARTGFSFPDSSPAALEMRRTFEDVQRAYNALCSVDRFLVYNGASSKKVGYLLSIMKELIAFGTSKNRHLDHKAAVFLRSKILEFGAAYREKEDLLSKKIGSLLCTVAWDL